MRREGKEYPHSATQGTANYSNTAQPYARRRTPGILEPWNPRTYVLLVWVPHILISIIIRYVLEAFFFFGCLCPDSSNKVSRCCSAPSAEAQRKKIKRRRRRRRRQQNADPIFMFAKPCRWASRFQRTCYAMASIRAEVLMCMVSFGSKRT